MRTYKLTIPQTLGSLHDLLGSMMLMSPEFTDLWFPGMNIDTTFEELTQGIEVSKARLGDDVYGQLMTLSQELRACYEAKDIKTGNMIADRMSQIIEKRGAQLQKL